MRTSKAIAPAALALPLGLAAALLVACGSSGVGLIPAASAGPLQRDFEAVAQAAEEGSGNCAATEAALGRTEQDFLALPATVDAGLRNRLDKGIANLRKRALQMCAQPAAPSTTTTTTPTSTTPTTTTTGPETTPTATTPTATTPGTPTSTTTTPTESTPGQGGGTVAPGEGSGEDEGGGGKGGGGGGDGAGGASPEGGK